MQLLPCGRQQPPFFAQHRHQQFIIALHQSTVFRAWFKHDRRWTLFVRVELDKFLIRDVFISLYNNCSRHAPIAPITFAYFNAVPHNMLSPLRLCAICIHCLIYILLYTCDVICATNYYDVSSKSCIFTERKSTIFVSNLS